METKMKAIALICGVLALLCVSLVAFAQQIAPIVDSPLSAAVHARLEANDTQVQSDIQSLEAQRESASAPERETIERQIADRKNQGEISRLEILLEDAQTRNDAARTEQIRAALNVVKNPPRPQSTPQILRDTRTGEPSAAPAVPQSK
jgi:hypothetical protein